MNVLGALNLLPLSAILGGYPRAEHPGSLVLFCLIISLMPCSIPVLLNRGEALPCKPYLGLAACIAVVYLIGAWTAPEAVHTWSSAMAFMSICLAAHLLPGKR